MLKLFLKIFAAITGAGAAIAIIIAGYAWGESLKPQPITKDEVREIVKEEVLPVNQSLGVVLGNQLCLFDNQELLKQSVVNHMRNKDSDNMDGVVNLLNGFRNDFMRELKKNYYLNWIPPERIQQNMTSVLSTKRLNTND